ncbi:FAD-binding oxidoreductase [Adhaeribacter radiodurans]|uniref:Flavodoxin reductase n=1 Tax=Adhaeribacter radiodurans TaxID=2745197 RepID=A0A7L7L5V5_9BACT|nr:FAD-binding oxidoreductase [Adhaeribacter radiodurans]QMU28202.1 flavodoxin reductase [Adhaeribacter radiodurans]
METVVKIKAIETLTHNVKKFRCEKPHGYTFLPGQATEVAINKKGWEKEKRPFTFTSLNESPELEFIIKLYKDHPGVTHELDSLKIGDELIVDDAWGAISYQGSGYFIAGGAGITPFIAILRQLHQEQKLAGNRLFFSNKTEHDIILQPELTAMLDNNVIYAITSESSNNYYSGYINESFLKTYVQDFSQHFYVCGPPPMVEDLQSILAKLGACPETVVFEK